MKYILILLLVFSAGCRSEKESLFKRPPVDYSQTIPAIDLFGQSFDLEVDSTIVFDTTSWDDLSSSVTGTLGRCNVETNTIIIDHRFWHDSDQEVRDALLFHELGHCILGLGHDEGIMSSFIGYTTYTFIEDFKEGLKYMSDMECSHGCSLERIKTAREEQ